MTKSEMAVELRRGVCKIEFTKVDGSHRVMMATLDPQEITKTLTTPGESPRKPNPNVLPVFDVEAQGWRSFRVDSVTKFDMLTLV